MKKKTKIAFLGDIMCGDSFYAMGKGVRRNLCKRGIDFLPESTREILSQHNAVFANVECVISDIDQRPRSLRSMQLRASPYAAVLLRSWGVTVANVANNHILEHGRKAACDTVKNLEAVGIKVVGAGARKDFSGGLSVAKLNCNDETIEIAGISMRNEKYSFNDVHRYEMMLFAERCANAVRPCICSIHWGDEYIDRPSHEQAMFARSLITSGATAVIGHHPHVVQGIEYSRGNLIAYSLGNFIFNGIWKDTRWSVILSLTFEGNVIAEAQLFPIVMDNEYRPHIAAGDQERTILKEVVRRNGILRTVADNPHYQSEYENDLLKKTAGFKKHLRLHTVSSIPTQPPIFWPQILARPLKRRIGTW
ncbi:Capsule biosynthesis protein CapA [Anaerohalosphaera lusitana]|uniref:Capsule biosynthesis protein CapA n=1 Tax=Anaerohalosphaera lusitana TaxID=1936003 RepID=A0A1U9NPM2_9BACT|nr:CapA family protein [Anaerohalosphaera lusitana]AQT69456.1 Capsule biosynthesis protein CapA [Anaerohalosphaera lusitana]